MPDPRALWKYTGDERPPFATPTNAGEESVWDYPRPPRVVADAREVVVRIGDVELARSSATVRVLETASPPTFYIPLADVRRELLVASPESRSTHCEWKGWSRYWSVVDGGTLLGDVAWSYPAPTAPFAEIAGCVSVYPGRLACFVDGERVRPQEGGFYGGWVTNEIVGPWKGGPGTSGW